MVTKSLRNIALCSSELSFQAPRINAQIFARTFEETSGEQRTKFVLFACITFAQYCMHIQLPGVVNQRVESNHIMLQSVSVSFDASKTVTSGDKVVEVQPVTTKFFGLSNSVWQRTQLPLKPCWAATVHKVQGLTLSRTVVDVGEAVFQAGMAYVPLCRVKSLQGLSLTALCEKRIFASEIVKQYDTLHSLR